jgi:predicted CopG family antitoxin
MKKLTITVESDVYRDLHDRIGRGQISRFLNALAKARLARTALEEEYGAMAADELREAEAAEWIAGTQGATWDETP